MTTDTANIEAKLDHILTELLAASHGSRCTARIDDPARGWNVDFVCAEAAQPGVKSLRGDGSINQRGADTVKWLSVHQRNLIQPDLTRNPDPAPPPALMSAYAAQAQMIAPIVNQVGELQAWISVHYLDLHDFTASEIAALDKAAADVKNLAGI
jgi:hypothetical protein